MGSIHDDEDNTTKIPMNLNLKMNSKRNNKDVPSAEYKAAIHRTRTRTRLKPSRDPPTTHTIPSTTWFERPNEIVNSRAHHARRTTREDLNSKKRVQRSCRVVVDSSSSSGRVESVAESTGTLTLLLDAAGYQSPSITTHHTLTTTINIHGTITNS